MCSAAFHLSQTEEHITAPCFGKLRHRLLRGSLSAHGYPRSHCQPAWHRVLAPVRTMLNGKGRRGRGKGKQGKQKRLSFQAREKGAEAVCSPQAQGGTWGRDVGGRGRPGHIAASCLPSPAATLTPHMPGHMHVLHRGWGCSGVTGRRTGSRVPGGVYLGYGTTRRGQQVSKVPVSPPVMRGGLVGCPLWCVIPLDVQVCTGMLRGAEGRRLLRCQTKG